MPKKNMEAKDINTAIGNKIKVYRYEKGLSRDALAKKIDITHQQLAKYENGDNNISVGKLVLLAKVLNKTLADFIDTGNNEIKQDNLSRLDLELIKGIQNIKDRETKEIINSFIIKLNKIKL
jgi:HTH-type transcriptional regulator/antitoxin HipB